MRNPKKWAIGLALALVVLIAAFKLVQYGSMRKAVKLCEKYTEGVPFSATDFVNEFREAKISIGGLSGHALLAPGKPISYLGVDMNRKGFEDANTLKQIDDFKMEGTANFTESAGFRKYTCNINFDQGTSKGITFRWWE